MKMERDGMKSIMMFRLRRLAGALTLAAATGMGTPVSPALAAGGSDPTPATTTAPTRASYQHAVSLIKSGDYAGGLAQLKALNKPDDANVLNYMGYASRKLGNLSDAQRYYDAALKINPKHKGAHEYYGELEVMRGKIDNAKKHLAALKTLCGTSCEEYRDLKEALEKAGHKVN